MIERNNYRRETKLRDIPERSVLNIDINVLENLKEYELEDKVYVVGSGLTYSQEGYFDREGLAENYNSVIRNPVYIIEYLLRKYYSNDIDIESFDYVAGLEQIRNIKCDFQIFEKINLEDIINGLLKSFFGILFFTGNGIKISSLYNKLQVGTIDKCLVGKNGNKLVKVSFDTRLYSSFVFRMWFNSMRNDYEYKFVINKEMYDLQFIGINPSLICSEIENKYGIKSVYEFDWNYGKPVQYNYMLRGLFDYYTNIKMMVEIYMDVKNGLKYELGDCVKINIPDIIPSSHNNIKLFNVIGKETKLGSNPYVKLLLLENVLTGNY